MKKQHPFAAHSDAVTPGNPQSTLSIFGIAQFCNWYDGVRVDGATVGLNEGEDVVGRAVGLAVGVNVGAAEGLGVGLTVGKRVGTFVGA